MVTFPLSISERAFVPSRTGVFHSEVVLLFARKEQKLLKNIWLWALGLVLCVCRVCAKLAKTSECADKWVCRRTCLSGLLKTAVFFAVNQPVSLLKRSAQWCKQLLLPQIYSTFFLFLIIMMVFTWRWNVVLYKTNNSCGWDRGLASIYLSPPPPHHNL